jgi:CHAT domain
MMVAPDEAAPEQDFPIQVSLTEQQLSSGIQILNGQAGGGKVGFSLPRTPENSWPIEVVLMGEGLEFTRGTTPASSIVLPLEGNATPAMYWARAVKPGVIHLLASFYYKRGFLAAIKRDIEISARAPSSGPPPARETVNDAGQVMATPAAFNTPTPAPDLTLVIQGNQVTVISLDFSQPLIGTMPKMDGLKEWLAQHAPISAGRGAKLIRDDTESNDGKGFGETLYDNYAPDVFKQAFWELLDKHGKDRTIQIFSDNPDIPWEYMRPVRETGGEREPFLGLNYSIAHWQMLKGGKQAPPVTEVMDKTFVIAPHYTGARTLLAEATETQALSHLDGYSPVNGNMKAVQEFFSHSPPGIVHFAGHGELNETHDNYEILLEDGALDTDRWRSMVTDHPASQTFFFFNACEVGQAKLAGNFVDGWGPAVLGKGASGYIGALFPVDDQVASDFSIYFYKKLHDRMKNGPADVSAILEQTRRDVYASSHNNPTALAYVLYGHTNLQFINAR